MHFKFLPESFHLVPFLLNMYDCQHKGMSLKCSTTKYLKKKGTTGFLFSLVQ